MGMVGPGAIRVTYATSPYGDQAGSAQVRRQLGEHRSCYPEPHDVQKPRIKSLSLYIRNLIGALTHGSSRICLNSRSADFGPLPRRTADGGNALEAGCLTGVLSRRW